MLANHLIVCCQLCGKPLPQGKILPADFFAICETCLKKEMHP